LNWRNARHNLRTGSGSRELGLSDRGKIGGVEAQQPDNGYADRGRVSLAALGPVTFEGQAAAEHLGIGRKALALLIYVAAAPQRRVSRAEIIALLWPDRFPQQAQQSLRQALTTLRQAGEQMALSLAEADRTQISTALHLSDVEFFSHPTHSSDVLPSLRLWRGDFALGLEGLSPAWDAWLNERRAAFRRQLHQLLNDAASAPPDSMRVAIAAEVERVASLHPDDGVLGEISAAWRRLAAEVASAPIGIEVVQGTTKAPPSTRRQILLVGGIAAGLAGLVGAAWLLKPPPLSSQPTHALPITTPFAIFVAPGIAALDAGPDDGSALRLNEEVKTSLATFPAVSLAQRNEDSRFRVETTMRGRAGDHVYASLRLIERVGGAPIWADTVALPWQNQGRSTQEMRQILQRLYSALLAEADRRRSPVVTATPEVQELVREGRAALAGGATRAKNETSKAKFEAALALAPAHADALLGLAHAHAMRLVSLWSDRPEAEAVTATRLIWQAMDQSARMPMAYFVLGLVHKAQRDYAKGLAAFGVASQLDPQVPAPYAQMAHLELLTGFPDRALPLAEKAIQLGPRANALDRALLYAGMARLLLDEPAAALAYLERAFAINQSFPDVFAWSAAALYLDGQEAKAMERLHALRTRWPSWGMDWHLLNAQAPGQAQRVKDALSGVGELLKMADLAANPASKAGNHDR
jgi:tetratricopeptide (TPR) repeat protein